MHILFKTTAKRESKQRQIISKGFYRSYIQFHFIKKKYQLDSVKLYILLRAYLDRKKVLKRLVKMDNRLHSTSKKVIYPLFLSLWVKIFGTDDFYG